MKNKTNITEAQLLLNQQVKIRAPWNANLRGQIATVKACDFF